MASGSHVPVIRTDVAFELERLEVVGDRLVVSGWWSGAGLRGMRFVRPTLLARERDVLATLDHKPWEPKPERLWTAEFPWDAKVPDPADAELSVAPSVTVPLAPTKRPARARRKPAASGAGAADAPDRAEPQREARTTRSPEAEVLRKERDRLRAELREVRERIASLEAERTRAVQAAAAEREVAERAAADRHDAERARAAAERESDSAVAQRDEAVAARDAAVRSRARMEAQRDEEVRRRREAEAQRDEARAQREEFQLAHGALQRRFDVALAGRDPKAAERVPEPPTSSPRDGREDFDRPIGVRSIPAARAVGPELHRAERADRPRISLYDVWALRVLGTIAAGCFVLLLFLLLRLFL
jgi:hypothetical protein